MKYDTSVFYTLDRKIKFLKIIKDLDAFYGDVSSELRGYVLDDDATDYNPNDPGEIVRTKIETAYDLLEELDTLMGELK